ncbi:MAG TPA: hypothetical protein VF543_13265 [Pyrinomonadaceae bacterium]|jgi:hypothetical protein
MSMNEPSSIERAVGARYRLLLIIWAAQSFALVTFFLLSLLVFGQRETGDATLFWLLSALSVVLVIVSFIIKRKYFAMAVEQQNTNHVQTGQIIAFALCEAAGLFGLTVRAVTGTPYFYLPFVVAALGLLLHFPKRETLMVASFRNRI